MAKKVNYYTVEYTGKGGHIRTIDKAFKTKKEVEFYCQHYNITNYKIIPNY